VSTSTPGAPPVTQREHRGSNLARRVTAVFSVITVLVTAVCAAGWIAANHLAGNITTIDVSSQLGTDRPTEVAPSVKANYAPLNILIMGTDTRTGQGSGFGNAADTSSGNGHSDTVILLHISGDRTRALGVSLPRDSWVTRPQCGATSNGTYTGKFNTAFAAGGPACTIKAVEYLTHVRIDHFVAVSFDGFESVVNALGGVPICLTHAVYDKKSHFSEPAGTHLLNGKDALAFARLRHNIGDGSDISREDRQQVFMSAVVRTATSKGVLTNPVKLYEVMDAITKSLTVDPGLGSLDDLKNFAESLQGVTPGMVKFMTVPWVPKGDNENVLWDDTRASKIWTAFRNDTPYPPKTTAPTGQKALTVSPSKIYVKVLNGSGVSGRAKLAAAQLEKLGFQIVGVGTAKTSNLATTTVSYAPSKAEAARTLVYATRAAATDTTATGSTMVVTVGKDWTSARTVTVASSSSGSSTIKSADTVSCVG
jgi:LCP family protein required for cell wall assembly